MAPVTHLGKTGYAKPFRSQTACGITAGTAVIVDDSPSCEVCHGIYLQELVNQEAEIDAWIDAHTEAA